MRDEFRSVQLLFRVAPAAALLLVRILPYFAQGVSCIPIAILHSTIVVPTPIHAGQRERSKESSSLRSERVLPRGIETEIEFELERHRPHETFW
jgi:hypothetical protein